MYTIEPGKKVSAIKKLKTCPFSPTTLKFSPRPQSTQNNTCNIKPSKYWIFESNFAACGIRFLLFKYILEFSNLDAMFYTGGGGGLKNGMHASYQPKFPKKYQNCKQCREISSLYVFVLELG